MTEVDDATPEKPSSPGEAATESPPLASQETDDSREASTLNEDGRERPRFLLAFPNDPELARLVRAFEAGNYEAVRVGAPALAASSEDPTVRAAARELRRRIDPDPLMKYLLGVALALFVFVVWYAYQNHAR